MTKLSEDGKTLIKVNNEDIDANGHFIVPDSVIQIGNCAFKYCTSLSSITIPNRVTKIGDGAFGYARHEAREIE